MPCLVESCEPAEVPNSSDHIETAFCLAALADAVTRGKQQWNGMLHERSSATNAERLLQDDFRSFGSQT